ncbi:MAG: hypothetical protein UY19_C0009G0031 [Candidatus Wolfebacteria bacterium GW2011_GWA2_47_9b]|uniref:Uncharacterized protein n=1 Tax=Candidatus Wolfebacteria bacterium GW2011_GWA2_47_9b TaxID=1619005 RepID=A0A0G1U6R6_9BACT|nr:MAG: hypothetical protein UY19_C0009G0031 [Candidatus Wolfebacteria bacterium GW2011_GWA2_47_9b]
MAKLGAFIDEHVGPELEKKGVTEADIESVIEKGGVSAVGMFVDAFMMCLQQARNAFRIMTGGTRTTDEVIEAGNYGWTNDMVNGKNFPMRPMPEGPREIVFLEFDHDPGSEEVLVEAQRQGLERPLYEDALFFGEQYPEEQRSAVSVRVCAQVTWVLGISCLVGRLNPWNLQNPSLCEGLNFLCYAVCGSR